LLAGLGVFLLLLKQGLLDYILKSHKLRFLFEVVKEQLPPSERLLITYGHFFSVAEVRDHSEALDLLLYSVKLGKFVWP
jgi:hypothetical protein